MADRAVAPRLRGRRHTGGSSTGRHRYDLWGAGYILMGAMEEEDFDYFMDW